LEDGIQDADADGLARLAAALHPKFHDNRVELDRRDVTQAIRTEDVSRMAVAHSRARAGTGALRHLQLGFRGAPGLVADGRDMGTVVFPSADLKVFLTASLEARAERRYKQLIEKGLAANMPDLLADLRVRDERDSTRAARTASTCGRRLPAGTRQRCRSMKVVAQILAWLSRSLMPLTKWRRQKGGTPPRGLFVRRMACR